MNELRGFWRGKRNDNGEWFVGYLYGERDGVWYLCDRFCEKYEVDPSTLGECTGLRDKNGTPIFERDIIKTKKYGKVVEHSNVNGYDIFAVKYEPAVFRLENCNRSFILSDDGCSKYEVIGNIHDNPELLKDVKRHKGR